MTDTTPRTLDCGKTIAELSDYLSADRIPFDPSIETCPECLNALQALSGVSQLSRDLLAQDVANLPPPPANWMEQIMAVIHNEVRAGRSVPLHHPDPRVTLTVTEGALRALIRSVGDNVPGIIIGKCQFDGDVQTPGAPIDVTVTASIAWKHSIPEAAKELRDAVRDALTTHTHLNVMSINVTVQDLHGDTTTPPGDAMSSDIDTPLAPDALDPDTLTAAVLEIDSVIDIYPSAPTIARAPQLVAALISDAPTRINRVDVRSDGTAHTLTARIGTHRHTPAPQAAALVADVLLARIPDGHDAIVTVQISRIA